MHAEHEQQISVATISSYRCFQCLRSSDISTAPLCGVGGDYGAGPILSPAFGARHGIPSSVSPRHEDAALLLVKSPARAKSRLDGELGAEGRRALAEAMLRDA